MSFPQVCIPSIHKATNPARKLTRSIRRDIANKKPRIPSDDLKSKRTVDRLHTIGVIKSEPIPVPELKAMIKDFYACQGKKPEVLYCPGYYGNRTTVVSLPGIGCVTIKYRESSEKWGLE